MDDIKGNITQGNNITSVNESIIKSHYDSLFKNNHSIMLLIDPETLKIVDANQAACSFYGYSHQDIIKLFIGDINTLPREQLISEMEKAMEEKRNYFNFQHRLSNGDIRHVEVYSGPIFHMDKELLYSIVHDITEKKKSENELVSMNNKLAYMVEERTKALSEANSVLEETNAQLEEEIAERVYAEEKLQLAMEETQDLYQNAPCGYHSLDKDGIFIKVNNTELNWLGYTREELIGKKRIVDFITPESKLTFLKKFPDLIKNGFVNDLEYEMIRKDGTTFFVLVSATAVKDADGSFLFSRSTLHDISELKKVQDKLNEMNSSLETMIFDRTNQLQEINAELEETNAMLEEEISERQRIEAELRKSEELYRSVYENSPLAFGIWDREFRFVDWNKRAEELFGWSKDEVIGKRITDFFVPKGSIEEVNSVTNDLLHFELNSTHTNENLTKDGKTLFCEWHNSLLHDAQGNLIGALSLGLDKTDSLKAEKALKEAKDQAEATNAELSRMNVALKKEIAERLEIEKVLIKAKFDAEQANMAKSQFLANMSHEIRTPMNGIIGMTDLALTTNLDSEQTEYLSIVKTSTRSLLRVLNDILDYSKIEAGVIDLDNTPFDIRKTTNEVMELFMIAAKQKKLDMKLYVEDAIPQMLIGDSVRLRQILSNLVGNGIKFTVDGEISIKISILRTAQHNIHLKFIVSDTGIGIPEDKLNKLFIRFSQVDDSNTRQFGGTGLGLAISKKLVEMMGGEIGVESKVNEGSKFFFTATFELQEEDAKKFTSSNALPEQPHMKNIEGKRVLLVEDDEVSRNLAVILLNKKGFRVTLAENGKEAIDNFLKEKFDLILMDINMPYMDGYTATAQIRSKEAELGLRHTPIIAMTAYALSGDREKCINAGMDDYISKPIDFMELFNTIDKWIGGL